MCGVQDILYNLWDAFIERLLEAALQAVLVLRFVQASHQCFQGEKHAEHPTSTALTPGATARSVYSTPGGL